MRWVFAFLLALVSWGAMAEGHIYLLLSGTDAVYEDAANEFREGLGKDHRIVTRDVGEVSAEWIKSISSDENLIVPVGLKAARLVASSHGGHGAVLALMVPRITMDKLRWPDALVPGRLSFVYIDQPLERSLSLLETLMPQRRRLGVIVSRENEGSLGTLKSEALRRELALSATTVDEAGEVGPALRRALANIDALLLLPDAVVLNPANIQSLLLASYRLRVPVLGFSPGLVKSGTVAAVFSTPEQIGRQGNSMARRWLGERQLPGPQHASEFSLGINHYVARSLGLSLPPETEVARQLGASPPPGTRRPE
ncbi:MAG: hypothetical protein H6935_03100 [Thiobacillus sp.]|nr:hypothetical protein [Thiobacillus sp.]